jgi:hypothetical protein
MTMKANEKQFVTFQTDRELASLAAEAARAQSLSASAWWRLAGLRALGAKFDEPVDAR